MKLIKFQVQEIAVPDEWNRPYYRTLEYGNKGKAIGVMDEMTTTMPMTEAKTVDYERVRLANGKQRWDFFVNFEEAKLVMPLLDGIVKTQTAELERQNYTLREYNAEQLRIIRRYEALWFVKLYNWIKQLVTKH